MLPSVLALKLRELQQPRLFQPICPNMLDRSGHPDPVLLRRIDQIVRDHAGQAISDWSMPDDLPTGSDPSDRWRAVSWLQKAIRRGDVRAAMAAAHAAHGMDPQYLFRRLVVCAVEDVLLGNLYAVAAALAFAGSLASRRSLGDQKVAVWLAAHLAGGWKDRSACNFCTVADLDRGKHPIMAEWAGLSDPALTEKAMDISKPLDDRILAAWVLAGSKWRWNRHGPPGNHRSRWPLMRAMAQSEMPLIFYWLADRTAVRGGDCMFAAFLPIWQVLQAAENIDIELRTNVHVALPEIGPLLSSAYDMYTRDGRVALRRFAALPSIAVVLAEIANPKDRFDALCAAVFIEEGGRLNVRVSLPELDHLQWRSFEVELEYFGVRPPQGQKRLLATVRQHLSKLHALRIEAVRLAHPVETIAHQGRSAPVNTQDTTHSPRGLPGLTEAPSQSMALPIRTLPDIEPTWADHHGREG